MLLNRSKKEQIYPNVLEDCDISTKIEELETALKIIEEFLECPSSELLWIDLSIMMNTTT